MTETEPLTPAQRDFLRLTIFVLLQHNYVDRALDLLEVQFVAGDRSTDVLLGRAIVRYRKGDWISALACLDDLERQDPLEQFGYYRLGERQRMRRFLKARCYFELQQPQRARDLIGVYLRNGTAGPA